MRSPFILFILLFGIGIHWCHAQSDLVPENYFGIMSGTSTVQGIRLTLSDRNGQPLAESAGLIPFTGTAFYQHALSRHAAVRFSSGYMWARYRDESYRDFSKIDSAFTTTNTRSTFSCEGFPLEISVLFHNSVDESQRLRWLCGIGVGYYSLNYQARITTTDRDYNSSRSREQTIENDPLTLAGWAQFFTLGFQLRLTQYMQAMCQLSKIGMSGLYLQRDLVRTADYHDKSKWQRQYGYTREHYAPKPGLNDLSFTVGLLWKL